MSRKPLSVQAQQDRLRRKRREGGEGLTLFPKPLKESLTSVLPITAIVLVLCFTITPISNNAMMAFLLGSLLLIVGMGLFTLGSEMSMIPLGEAVGKEITRSKKVWVIVAIGAPCFQPFAGILPLLFPRITIYYLQITGKYKPLAAPQEPVDVSVEDDPAPAPAQADGTRDEGGET